MMLQQQQPQQQQQQQQQQLTIPSFSDCFRFKGEYNIIFKIARLLRGGDPAVQISDEIKRIVDTLGEKIIAAVTTPATTQPAERRRERLDDNEEQNNNKDECKHDNMDDALIAGEKNLRSRRSAAALAAVMYDRALEAKLDSRVHNVSFADLHAVFETILGDTWNENLRDLVDCFVDTRVTVVRATIREEQLNLLRSYASPQQQQQKYDDAEDADLLELIATVLQAALPPVEVSLRPAQQTLASSCTSPKGKPKDEFAFDIENNEYNFDYTTVTQNKNLRDALEAAFQNGDDENLESALQKALENCFNGRTFGEGEDAMVILPTTRDNHQQDDFDGKFLYPDFSVFRADEQNAMGRIAVIEIKRWTEPAATYDVNKHIKQLLGYLAATLMENPFRESVYGILTNGTWFTMYRVRFLDRRSCFDLLYEKLVRAEKPANFNENQLLRVFLLNCMEWFLSRTPAELGLTVPHPTFDPVSGIPGGDYTLGPTLGTGESCRVYSCVEVEKRRTPAGCAPINWSRDHVAKLYASKEDADHEHSIYERVRAFDVQNTTRMLARHADGSKNMIFVTPLAVHFLRNGQAARVDNAKRVPLRQIELSHVHQLIVALRGLHNAGIVHCDIQPQNLFCDVETGTRALVNDFGRAKLREDMKFCEFRRLVRNDFIGLAMAVKNLEGGKVAWESAMNAMAATGDTTFINASAVARRRN